MEAEYKVCRLMNPICIDGDWEKPQWKSVEAIQLNFSMGSRPKFRPMVLIKMAYDPDNLYLIFKVEDQFVRCITQHYNGPVWEDSCVEFFFSADQGSFEKYFNLEINCGGTPLMYYNLIPRKDFKIVADEDLSNLKIAHSMPKVVENEIIEPVRWTIECKIPVSLLSKYGKILNPSPGVIWKANFYKIADKTSNPHYLTWSLVEQVIPDFHLPEFFGKLIFQ
jgi:hypothetical protein